MKKDILVYNFIFPTSMLYFILPVSPPALLFVLAANFVLDSLVLLLLFSLLKLKGKADLYKKTVVRAWLLGFAADFIASSGIFGAYMVFDRYICLDLYHVAPWKNPAGFLFVTAGVALAGVLIYVFQRKIVLKGTALDENQKRKIALGMAVLTAPYTMYLPPLG